VLREYRHNRAVFPIHKVVAAFLLLDLIVAL